MRKFSLILALVAILSGGLLLADPERIFCVIRQGSNPVVMSPKDADVWGPPVGAACDLVMLQAGYEEEGAPEALGDPTIVLHLDASSISPREPEWELFAKKCPTKDCVLRDAQGRIVTTYFTHERETCDPWGDKTGKPCLELQPDGTVVENARSCRQCRVSVNMASETVRDYWADRFAAAVTVAAQGYRPNDGIYLDNTRAWDYEFSADRIDRGRVSAEPAGMTPDIYFESTKGALEVWAKAVKAADPDDPDKIFLINACTIASPANLPAKLGKIGELLGVVDGCTAEQWTGGRPGNPTLDGPKWSAQIRTAATVVSSGNIFVGLTSLGYPKATKGVDLKYCHADYWTPEIDETTGQKSGRMVKKFPASATAFPCPLRTISLFLANGMLVRSADYPEAFHLSFWGGVALSAAPTAYGGDTLVEDFPLLDRDCGVPLGAASLAEDANGVPTGVGSRQYSGCIVVANSSRADFPVKIQTGEAPDGKPVHREFVVERGTGLVYVRPEPIFPTPGQATGRKVVVDLSECRCECRVP